MGILLHCCLTIASAITISSCLTSVSGLSYSSLSASFLCSFSLSHIALQNAFLGIRSHAFFQIFPIKHQVYYFFGHTGTFYLSYIVEFFANISLFLLFFQITIALIPQLHCQSLFSWICTFPPIQKFSPSSSFPLLCLPKILMCFLSSLTFFFHPQLRFPFLMFLIFIHFQSHSLPNVNRY